jgi:hypothetical protein
MGKSPRKPTSKQGCVIHRRGEKGWRMPSPLAQGDRGGEK